MYVKKAFLAVSLLITILVAIWAMKLDVQDAAELQQNQDILDEVRGR